MDAIDGFRRKVIAPVPHFPMMGMLSGRYRLYEQMPFHEVQDNIDVYHPKYFTLPGLSIFDNATSMANAAENILSDLYPDENDFDIVDGQYLYPDGVAAYKLAKNHNKPLILTARGSDVNYWMDNKKAQKQILEAIDYSDKVICVSDALKQSLIDFGVDENKIIVIINGVDPSVFNTAVDANPLREDYFLSVGNLIPLKGHNLTLNAFFDLSKTRLIIIGDGAERQNLKKQAENLGIKGRVQFIKHVDQNKLAEFYAGAKATILMSSMEGMPNVVLESLATGTPVIACDVGGVSEILNEQNGILLDERSEYALANAVRSLETLVKSRDEIAETVKDFRWDNVASKQYEVYKEALSSI
ncbi:MAG: glycosyltransferase [Emcibacteraceae bacterium]